MFIAHFDRELFLEKLNKLQAFIPKKSVTPCFDNIFISIDAGIAEVLASDGQTQIRIYSACRSKDTFMFCVPSKIFISTISLFRENEIKVSVKDNKLVIKSGKSKYNITLDTFPQDYPVMELKDCIGEITLRQFYLKQGLKAAETFVGDKNSHVNLNGVHIALIDKEIVFTGSEQQLLCRCAIKPISINKWHSIVLPTETANKTCTVLSDKGEINITVSKDKVLFAADTDSIEKIEIISTLSEAIYPNTEALFKVLPEDNFIANVSEFSDALKRLKLYAFSEVPAITIYSENTNEIVIVSKDDTIGKSGEEVLSVRELGDKKFRKTYHADWLIKIMKEISDNEFAFHYDSVQNKPSQVLPIITNDGKEENYKFLLVAMMEV